MGGPGGFFPFFGFVQLTILSRDKYPLLALWAVALAGLALLYAFSSVFLPVLVAVILAYVLNPLVSLMERRGVHRTVATLLVFGVIVVFATGSVYLFATSIGNEFRNVQINLPAYVERLYNFIPQTVKVYLDIETQDKLTRQINRGIEELRGVSFEVYRETFSYLTRAFTSTLSFILVVIGYFITPIYLFYFLTDLPRLKGALLELFPERSRGKVNGMAQEIDEVLSAFVRGQLSVCAILAVLYSAGLYFIGIDLAIVIGTMAGILFIIPYLGTAFGIVLSVIMAFLKFHDMLHPLLCLGWFLLVQALEGGVITPAIVGHKVGLHPVVAILALFIGGQWFGILGMLLAVPVAAVIKVLLRSLHDWYLDSAYYRGAQ